MILTDKTIKKYGECLIQPYSENNVESICYDLTIDKFCVPPDKYVTSYNLKPTESVFIMSTEIINLPKDLSAIIMLRNSRIRQGLTLDAPIYQPGHKTPVYFRITNVSNDEIDLSKGNKIATILFEKLDDIVEKPYSGTFQNEFDFNGMGEYTNLLSSQMHKVAKKEEELRDMEHRLYTNVLSIMAIFVAVFTIINVNAVMVSRALELKTLVVMNLSIIGSVGFLLTLVDYFFNSNGLRKLPVIVIILCFVLAICIICKW